MSTVAASPIFFDDATHAYRVGDVPVPSVTQILRATGISSDFNAIPQETLERKRLIGDAVHRACHYFDEGDLVETSVAPQVLPYVEAWMRFRSERGFVPDMLETRLYSGVYHFAGTLDRLGRVPEGRRVLADIKTGDPDDAAADLQLAAYLVALREMRPELADQVIERWSVQLRADGTYKLLRYPKPGRSERLDRTDFLALARSVNLRQERQGGPPCWT